MKLYCTLKDPTGAYEFLDNIEDASIREEIAKTFFGFEEYLDLEIDTETMEAKVLKQV